MNQNMVPKNIIKIALGLAFLCSIILMVSQEKGSSLIPQELLFGNPTYKLPLISPDGTKIAYIAPSNGVMNIWVCPVSDLSHAQVITHDTDRGIGEYWWGYDSETLFYRQDRQSQDISATPRLS